MSTNTILATTPLVSTNYLLRATGTTIGNSLIWDNGTNVGIGNTNTTYKLEVTGTLAVSGAATFSSVVGANIAPLANYGLTTKGLYGIWIQRNSVNDSGLEIYHDGTNSIINTSYQSTGSYGGMLIYTGGYERMRITSGGQIYTSNAPVGDWSMRVIGSSSTSNSYGFKVLGGTNSSDLAFSVTPQNGSVNYFFIRGDGYMCSPNTYNNTTANAANLSIQGSGYFERSTSSIRFKTNVEDLKIDTSNILSKMRPIWYRSLGQNDRKDWSWYGFIAEEIAEIEPRLVHWGKDENDNDIADGVQYERITVLLVAEMQKMNKTIEELSNRLIKLESK